MSCHYPSCMMGGGNCPYEDDCEKAAYDRVVVELEEEKKAYLEQENELAAICEVVAKLQAEIADMKAHAEAMETILIERCTIDDCGFDVDNESIETLRACLKAIDAEVKKALEAYNQFRGGGEVKL